MGKAISGAFFWLFSLGVAGCSALLIGLGGLLVAEGGSWFYLASGLVLMASSVQLFRGRRSAIALAALVFLATWAWALAEVGLDGWALLPRVNFITLLLPLYTLPWISGRLRPERSGRFVGLISRIPAKAPLITAVAVAGIVTLLVATQPIIRSSRIDVDGLAQRHAASSQTSTEDHFGQDQTGAKFSHLTQINPGNVDQLELAWAFSEPKGENRNSSLQYRDEAMPLEADGRLFICLGTNAVVALDAEDGTLLWRFDPEVDMTGIDVAVCRGVAFHDAGMEADQGRPCAQRILIATQDSRLVAVDARTGRRCTGFGNQGEVSLRTGIGDFAPGYYKQTSPPVVLGNRLVIGGAVLDNMATGEPSGVIRAYDVTTGELAWAWDAGRPGDNRAPLPGETYTRGTPNSWSLMSADPELGLVYVPTGNATPDFVGAHRDPLWEPYSSALVALDIDTGRPRWTYQFVHHDVWDLDTAAQPALFDMPTADGPVPAVLQATKNGLLFVLDRRTGIPLVETDELPVPQTDILGEWTSPTQPFPTGMPSVGGPELTEAQMWGLTPFDQLLCRINFRQNRYEGMYTPPSIEGTINYPSQVGGVNWGGVSIDRERDILLTPSMRFAMIVRLAPRNADSPNDSFVYPQAGTSYGVQGGPFMTALGVPCQQPPYATMTAIDLRSRTVIWERPLGTAEHLGPLGIRTGLPISIGAPPVVGGGLTTAGGLTFIGAVGDRKLRAIESATGRELWVRRLLEGNQATPATYIAPRSKRQMVVMVSGGQSESLHGGSPSEATYVVAYALPQR